MKIKKLNMKRLDTTQKNIAYILEFFPDCVTEIRNDNGGLRLAVDFDLLRQELSGSIVDGPHERYRLDWPGKRKALLSANTPIIKTLRPYRKESIDFDVTQNLFIEGDNLEALKLLQEAYLGKIKMIYIDPPYNTGSDLIYDDDFTEFSEDYLLKTTQKDEVGNRLISNSESNGRFHSDWLSMMYPRLKIAERILADDGLIFLSIDENERNNLGKICDEVFGAVNFIGCFVRKRRSGAMDAVTNISEDHEYILVYSKSRTPLTGIRRTFEKYKNPDNDPRGPWISDNLSAGKPGGDTYYAIIDPDSGSEFWPPKGRYWPYSRKTMAQKIEEGRILFPKKVDGTPMLKRFAAEAVKPTLPVSSWIENPGASANQSSISAPMNSSATKGLMELMGGKLFSFPKPVELLTALISQATSKNSIVMDFFAGSSTTAHAVMQQNAKDGSNRKFIMVQVSEPCHEKSEAFKAGYKTIPELSKERIRRAGGEVLAGECHENWNKDVGFRVLKVDSSNMADVYSTPNEIEQMELLSAIDSVNPDRNAPEDLLFQVLVDWGVDLSLPIRRETIQGKTVFFVNNEPYDLVGCFDTGINEELVKELARHQPMRVVFRDNGFVSDAVKINAGQIFRQLSPATDVKSI